MTIKERTWSHGKNSLLRFGINVNLNLSNHCFFYMYLLQVPVKIALFYILNCSNFELTIFLENILNWLTKIIFSVSWLRNLFVEVDETWHFQLMGHFIKFKCFLNSNINVQSWTFDLVWLCWENKLWWISQPCFLW